jgi:hypothetical protein
MRDTSKQAFPSMDMNHREGIPVMELRYEGMTLLEYYVAHAPEPQKWFKPVMPEKPKVLLPLFQKFGSGSSHKYEELYRKYYDDENGDWPTTQEIPQEFIDEVAKYLKDYNVSYDAAKAWVEENKKQHYIQWPLAWAKEMIRQLEQTEEALIVIRVAGDKVYSNMHGDKFDVSFVQEVNHEYLKSQFNLII